MMRFLVSLLVTMLAFSHLTVAMPYGCDQLVVQSGSPKTQNLADKVENSYIIKIKDEVDKKSTLYWVKQHLDRDSKIVHDYEPAFFNAFAGFFSSSVLGLLKERDDIEYIRQDAIAELAGAAVTAPVTQMTSPWGLSRISHSGQARPPFFFPYNSPAGAGVDIYVVDTGIYVDHMDFGGRATWGWTAPGLSTFDANGHGTHCAAIAAGALYGPAKHANIIAVKAMNDDGLGAVSNLIAAIDWIVKESRFTLRASVVTMNLRVKPGDIALDAAVQSAINEGLHFVVAAGNDNEDAKDVSPARVSDCITVGAIDINDQRMKSSNHGSIIDMYAPGVNVLSAWIGHPWASAVQSGTSTAAPIVAGIAAYNLAQEGKMSTESLRILLREKREEASSGLLVARL